MIGILYALCIIGYPLYAIVDRFILAPIRRGTFVPAGQSIVENAVCGGITLVAVLAGVWWLLSHLTWVS